MENSDQEVYLDDIINKNTKARPNLDKRKGIGYGAANNIMAISNEVPLAHLKIQAGLQLFINGALFNSESKNLFSADIAETSGINDKLTKKPKKFLQGQNVSGNFVTKLPYYFTIFHYFQVST